MSSDYPIGAREARVCRRAPTNHPPVRVPPPKPVYTWDNPAPVIVIRSAPEVSCHVGVIFVWDNGAGLANTSCEIRFGNGQILDATLNEQSFISQRVNSDRHKVQLQAWFDPKSALTESRAELKKILEEILVVERQEAAELQKVQDQRSALESLFYAQQALGKGFLLGAWGLVRTLDEFSDLVDPFTLYTNAARSAWNAQSTRDKTWIDSFRENFSAEHHRELVEALGFDPSSITREQLAQAYEMACFIFEDDDSKRTLAKFAMDYAQAQNHEEIIEFSGGVAFEIVLAALLIALTGGIGLAARGSAASAKLLPLLKRLGATINTLGRNLRNARLHTKGRAEGQGTKAQTVEIPRPGEVKPVQLSPLIRKSRNKPPPPLLEAEGRSHTIIERPGREGQYTTHYEDGTWKQYRGSGKDHGRLPRPNIKEGKINTNGSGGSFLDKGRIRTVRDDEYPGSNK